MRGIAALTRNPLVVALFLTLYLLPVLLDLWAPVPKVKRSNPGRLSSIMQRLMPNVALSLLALNDFELMLDNEREVGSGRINRKRCAAGAAKTLRLVGQRMSTSSAEN